MTVLKVQKIMVHVGHMFICYELSVEGYGRIMWGLDGLEDLENWRSTLKKIKKPARTKVYYKEDRLWP